MTERLPHPECVKAMRDREYQKRRAYFKRYYQNVQKAKRAKEKKEEGK